MLHGRKQRKAGIASVVAIVSGLCLSATTEADAQNSSSIQRADVSAVWKGWHQCGRAKVGTSATIRMNEAGRVTGTRDFYPTPSDAQRASGSFRVSGAYQPATGAITLMAGDWINQPPGYGKCSFVGNVDSKGTIMTGTSPDCVPGCAQFELRRQ